MSQRLEALGELLKEVSEREIMPRWRRLGEGDILAKPSAAQGQPGTGDLSWRAWAPMS